MSALIDRLEKMLANGEDTALLRFGLGNAYVDSDPLQAVRHLRCAVELDPSYSAAWKMLARALDKAGEKSAAIDAYREGIDVAENRGDKQAAREMTVFLKRLLKQ